MTTTADTTATVEVVRDVYRALGGDDPTVLTELLADDVELHVPGRHSMAGTYTGAAGVLRFVAGTRTMATETVDVIDVLAGDRHVAALCLVHADRLDRPSLENRTLHVFEIDDDGRIASIRFHNADQHAVDAFWR